MVLQNVKECPGFYLHRSKEEEIQLPLPEDTVPSHVTLTTGHRMPTLGLGTFQATKPGEAKAAVVAALEGGYRLLHCAGGYGNEHEVG